MDKRRLIAATSVSLLALGILAAPPASRAAALEKCFGAAKAGENACAGVHHCAALSDLHGCKGSSKVNYDPADFRLVPDSTCAKLGGLDEQQAKALLKHPRAVHAFEAQMQKRNS